MSLSGGSGSTLDDADFGYSGPLSHRRNRERRIPMLSGVVHLAVAFHLRAAGRVIWRALVGLAYILFGVYLIAHPVIGVASLTLVLASLFLVEGIFDIALFFQVRSIHGSAWILFDGIMTLLLGLLMYLQWPSSSA